MNVTPAFQGEVQFRRWSDSSTQGVQVTFALPDSDALEPLKHKAGKRFMAVLVEIGDDELPVQQPRKDTRGPLCREACDYCRLPAFIEWLRSRKEWEHIRAEDEARQWILDTCQIASRKELDTDAEAAADFVKWVRVPFMHWQRTAA